MMEPKRKRKIHTFLIALGLLGLSAILALTSKDAFYPIDAPMWKGSLTSFAAISYLIWAIIERHRSN